MKNMLNEAEAAEFLGISCFKMRRDRRLGSQIPYVKVGRSVRYRLEDIKAYIERQTFRSTSNYVRG